MTPAEIIAEKHRRAYLDACREALGKVDYDRPNALKAFEAGVRRDDYITSVAAAHPVGTAFNTMRTPTLSWASLMAEAFANGIIGDLKDVDWDVEQAAPFPAFEDRFRKTKRERYDAFRLFTATDLERSPKGYTGRGKPHYVKLDDEALAAHLQQFITLVERQFDAALVQTVAAIGSDATSVSAKDASGGDRASVFYLSGSDADGKLVRWDVVRDASMSGLGIPRVDWRLTRWAVLAPSG
jgi:hypothetical protein